MRDDLSSLLDCIIQHQKKKIILITDFLNREFEFKHLLNGKVEDKLIEIIDFEDEINTKQAVLVYYKRFKSGSLNVKTGSVERFSRRSLTGELAKLLNTL